MEKIFEVKTVITKEILTEFAQKTYNIRSKKMRSLLLFMSLAFALMAFYSFYGKDYWSFSLMILGTAFLIFMFFKGYIFTVNENLKNFKGLYGQVPQLTYVFSEENLNEITSQSNLTLDYNEITNIMETKKLYILIIKKVGVILEKDGFTVGNANAFKLFIDEKCKIQKNKIV